MRRRPQMRPVHISALALVLVAGGSAAAYGATVSGGTTSPNLPPGKQAIQQGYDARKAAAASKNTAADKRAVAAAAQALQQGPVSAAPTGILDTQEGPFSASSFLVQNAWQGPVGGNWVAVYAGEILKGQDVASGQPGLYVYVYKSNWDGAAISNTYYPLPAAVGSASEIVSASNGVLSISSSDGTSNTFDIASGTVK
jgi:hypothetical protein